MSTQSRYSPEVRERGGKKPGRFMPFQAALIVRRHCSAQLRQAWAQLRQASLSCFSHSAAQVSHTSTQKAHHLADRGELRAMLRAQA